MFIDDSRKELNVVGESIVSLSTKHGFDHFFINEQRKEVADYIISVLKADMKEV